MNELAKQPPEVLSIACIDQVESAADKLSAIAWLIPDRVRGDQYDDPSIVRHIHDLAMLKDRALAYAGFAELVIKSMKDDDSRAKRDLTLEGKAIQEKLAKMLDLLFKDASYPDEYRHFVEDVSYAKTGAIPEFESAVKSLKEIIDKVLAGR